MAVKGGLWLALCLLLLTATANTAQARLGRLQCTRKCCTSCDLPGRIGKRICEDFVLPCTPMPLPGASPPIPIDTASPPISTDTASASASPPTSHDELKELN